MIKVMVENYEMEVEFHVLYISSSFYLLLGRPWLHHLDIMVVPSTLHQKVKLGRHYSHHQNGREFLH